MILLIGSFHSMDISFRDGVMTENDSQTLTREWLESIGGIAVQDGFPIVFSNENTEVYVSDVKLAKWRLRIGKTSVPISVNNRDNLRRLLIGLGIWGEPPDYVIGQYSQMLEWAMKGSHEERALRIVKEAFRTSEEIQSTYVHDGSYLNSFVKDLKLVNTLEDCGVFTVDDLYSLTEEDVMLIENLGPGYVAGLKRELEENGITWPLDF